MYQDTFSSGREIGLHCVFLSEALDMVSVSRMENSYWLGHCMNSKALIL